MRVARRTKCMIRWCNKKRDLEDGHEAFDDLGYAHFLSLLPRAAHQLVATFRVASHCMHRPTEFETR